MEVDDEIGNWFWWRLGARTQEESDERGMITLRRSGYQGRARLDHARRSGSRNDSLETLFAFRWRTTNRIANDEQVKLKQERREKLWLSH